MFEKFKQKRLMRKIKKTQSKIKKINQRILDEPSMSKRESIKIDRDKLKEELIKMAKLALEGGKIVERKEEQAPIKPEGVPTPQHSEVVPEELQEVGPNPFEEIPLGKPIPQELRQPRTSQPRYEEHIQQQPIQQQPGYEQPYQQPYQQSQQAPQGYYPPQPQQEQYQPQFQQQESQADIDVVVNIYNLEPIIASVPASQIEGFVEELSEAINNQAVFQIGSDVLNGRYIISFSY